MKSTLNAVHDDDLEELLKKFNLYKKILRGEIKCKFTDTIITIDNLYSIFPESGSIKVVCDSPEAIKMFAEHINEGRIENV